MVLSRGFAPRTSAFAERRAETNYTLRANLVSVAGLAPARTSLKGWMLELLWIHGLLAQGHQMAPEVGIAPTSPRLQRGANLPQLFGEMVVLAGNAPASSGYQPGALLLSYGTVAEGVGNAPTSAMPILFSGQVQPAYICLPSVNWLPGLDLHQHRAV